MFLTPALIKGHLYGYQEADTSHLQQEGKRALTWTCPTAVRLHLRFALSLGWLKLCMSRKIRAELSVFYIHSSATKGFLTQTTTRLDASWCDCHLIVKSGQNTLNTQARCAYFSQPQSFSHEQLQEQIRMSVKASHPELAANVAVVQG